MATDSEKEPKKEEESTKKKISSALDSLKQNENFAGLVDYARKHTKDTIAYILMVFGIIWMFLHNFNGGILVGLIAGFYFFKEIVQFVKTYDHFFNEQGLARCLIIGGTLVAFFISTPGIFIGAAVMVGLMVMLKMDV